MFHTKETSTLTKKQSTKEDPPTQNIMASLTLKAESNSKAQPPSKPRIGPSSAPCTSDKEEDSPFDATSTFASISLPRLSRQDSGKVLTPEQQPRQKSSSSVLGKRQGTTFKQTSVPRPKKRPRKKRVQEEDFLTKCGGCGWVAENPHILAVHASYCE